MPSGQGSTDIYSRVFGSGDSQSLLPSEGTIYQSPEFDELGGKVMKHIADSEGNFATWEGPAREDNRFYHGEQWDDLDRMRMEQLKRPALQFNDIKPIIDAVSGMERLNRTDCTVQSRPLDSNDQEDLEGDLATEALSACDDLTSGMEEDSEIAKKAAITGMAWGEVSVSFEDSIDGRVVYKEIPCWEMRWDPNCHRVNLEGSEWRARKRSISRKKFDKQWPGKLAAVDSAVPDMPYGQTQKYELVVPYYSIANEKANPQVGSQTQTKSTVDVIQYQWKDSQTVYRFQDDDSGQITTLDEDKWDTMVDRLKQLGLSAPAAVRQQQPIYKEVKVSRGIVLEDPIELPCGFSLLCLTGQYDDDKKRFYGLVRSMKDPQKTKNKAISSALGFHITNSKGGVVFKTRVFADPINAKDQWSRYDAWIEAEDTADLQKDILMRQPTTMPPELPMFYSESTKAITRSAGVSEEMVGLAVGQTPSQTAKGRSQAGVVVLGWFWDNLARHRRERSQVMLEFIREFWTQGQLIQVGGDSKKQLIPLFKESLPDKGKYSFVLDESIRHNPNLKAQIWSELQESGVLQALMKFGMGQIILQLLKYSPFPAQLVQNIQKSVAQSPPQPPQKGRGKSNPPEMDAAKTQLYSAQAQKALAQARDIDSKAGLKMADIIQKGIGERNKMAQHHDKHQLATQQAWTQGFGNNAFGGADQQ
jgi:hypothetical protein